jgi:hypothetical protein
VVGDALDGVVDGPVTTASVGEAPSPQAPIAVTATAMRRIFVTDDGRRHRRARSTPPHSMLWTMVGGDESEMSVASPPARRDTFPETARMDGTMMAPTRPTDQEAQR